jgi:hypothetical protein
MPLALYRGLNAVGMEDDMSGIEALKRALTRKGFISPAARRRVASSPLRRPERPRLRGAEPSSGDLGYLRLWLAAAALRAHQAHERMIRVAAL